MIIIPRSWATDPEIAFLLSAVGGTLIFVEGALVASTYLGFLAALALVSGAAIVAAAASFRSRLTNRRPLGALIVVLSLVSFVGLNGWYLGGLFGLIGGALAIAASGGRFRNPMTSTFTPAALGPPCPRCGRHIPAWTSQCPYCGAPD